VSGEREFSQCTGEGGIGARVVDVRVAGGNVLPSAEGVLDAFCGGGGVCADYVVEDVDG